MKVLRSDLVICVSQSGHNWEVALLQANSLLSVLVSSWVNSTPQLPGILGPPDFYIPKNMWQTSSSQVANRESGLSAGLSAQGFLYLFEPPRVLSFKSEEVTFVIYNSTKMRSFTTNIRELIISCTPEGILPGYLEYIWIQFFAI